MYMHNKKGQINLLIIIICLFCTIIYILYFNEFRFLKDSEISLLDKIRILSYIESNLAQNDKSFIKYDNKEHNKLSFSEIKILKNVNLSILKQKLEDNIILIIYKIKAPNWNKELIIKIFEALDLSKSKNRKIEYYGD